jgi:hypothetical protein
VHGPARLERLEDDEVERALQAIVRVLGHAQPARHERRYTHSWLGVNRPSARGASACG